MRARSGHERHDFLIGVFRAVEGETADYFVNNPGCGTRVCLFEITQLFASRTKNKRLIVCYKYVYQNKFENVLFIYYQKPILKIYLSDTKLRLSSQFDYIGSKLKIFRLSTTYFLKVSHFLTYKFII